MEKTVAFLPGLSIETGGIIIKQRFITYPRDILHEAGEMMAIKFVADKQQIIFANK